MLNVGKKNQGEFFLKTQGREEEEEEEEVFPRDSSPIFHFCFLKTGGVYI
jgi:hypothetical protein